MTAVSRDILTVEVYEGRRLENKRGLIGKTDAYVELTLGEERLRTEIRHNAGCAAQWDETFKFLAKNYDTLTIAAYDYDRYFNDDLIGEAAIPLPELSSSSTSDADEPGTVRWVEVKSKDGKVTGQLRLSLYYDPDPSLLSSSASS